MTRMQIQLTEELVEGLKAMAARENASVAEIVRRAVDRFVGSPRTPSREEFRRRAREVAGRFSSGRSDVAKNHDRVLAEAYRR
jgi:metal-responsive CopG/Arc/MetJ family transcriptional regulator